MSVGTKKYTFGREESLKSKKIIEELFKNGSSFRLYPFTLVSRPASVSVNQILISIPKKNHKKAVDRNLLKRRIREVYRLNKHILTDASEERFSLALIYLSKDIMNFEELQRKLIKLFTRFSKEYISKSHE